MRSCSQGGGENTDRIRRQGGNYANVEALKTCGFSPPRARMMWRIECYALGTCYLHVLNYYNPTYSQADIRNS